MGRTKEQTLEVKALCLVKSHMDTAKCPICGRKMVTLRSWDSHHIDATTKEHNMSDLICGGYSLDRIMRENKKVMWLCQACHSDIHAITGECPTAEDTMNAVEELKALYNN